MRTDPFDGTPIIDSFRGENGFLSNFYQACLTWKGVIFETSEHAYQWDKTDNPTEKNYILYHTNDSCDGLVLLNNTPGVAKRRGHEVKKRPDWNAEETMYEVLIAKFTQNPELCEKLLATGDTELIEGNTWHDNDWGHCTCEDCKDKTHHNMLGKMLMRLRSELKTK